MLQIVRKLADEGRFCTHCGLAFTRAAIFIDTCFICEQKGHNPKNGAICEICDPEYHPEPKIASDRLKTPAIEA